MSEPVRVDVEDETLIVTLDRPKANAIDVATSQALHAAFERLNDDPGLRVGVVTGAGERFFCAGWDLHAASDGEAITADHGPGGFAGLTEYFDLDKPVIAAVNGLALGGGFELALAADLIVAAEHAEFALPEVGLGMVADSGGVLRLPRRLPRTIATEMLMTGRRMGAGEARRWGLVNDVADTGDVVGSALRLSARVRAGAPLALAAIKEIARATETAGVEEGFATLRGGHLTRYAQMLESADAVEGPRAFAEKRRPVWTGSAGRGR
ncbi:MAG TPA: enoyl-CoA hydratase-related protein [Nocardioidaceae bacterium]|nr:enoyl-CoA hydratase-related protein [Nocardioidaceae bacterium]